MDKKSIFNRLVSIFIITIMLFQNFIFIEKAYGADDSMIISVGMDTIYPNPITDLIAITDNTEDGSVSLSWTTPGDDGINGQLPDYPYFVKYDTRSVTDLGGSTTSWWELAGGIYPAGGWGALSPGTIDNTKSLGGLLKETTYYFGIKAKDKAGNISKELNVTKVISGNKPPVKPEGFKIVFSTNTRLDMNWVLNKESDIQTYRIYRSTFSSSLNLKVFVKNIVHPDQIYSDVGLLNNLTYYYQITAVDNQNNEGQPSDEIFGYPVGKNKLEVIIMKCSANPQGNEIDLEWSNPEDKDYFGSMIRFSTGSFPENRNAGTPLENFTKNTTYYIHNNLIDGVTYYYSFFSYNDKFEFSERVSAAAYPKDIIAPASLEISLDSITINSCTIKWITAGDNVKEGTINNGKYKLVYYNKNDLNNNVFINWEENEIIPDQIKYRVITGLIEDTEYGITLQTADEAGNWSGNSNILSIKTFDTTKPGIVSLSIYTVDQDKVELSWINPGDNGNAGEITGGRYEIGYSTTGVIDTDEKWNNILPGYKIIVSTKIIPGERKIQAIYDLKKDRRYWFNIRVYDESNNASDLSESPSIKMFSAITPKPPAGIKLIINKNIVEIKWSKMTRNTDGSEFKDKSGYRIYRSENLYDGWEEIGFVSGDSDESCTWKDTFAAGFSTSRIYYYKVCAVNIYGNESDAPMICDTSVNLNIISLSSDKKAYISIPKMSSNSLYKNEQQDEDVIIKIENKTEPNISDVLSVYELSALKAISNKKIENFKFSEGTAEISIKYENNDNYDITKNKITNLENYKKIPNERKDISLFWYNGLEWIKLSSQMQNGMAFVNSSRLGKYMIKKSLQSNTFVLTKVYPQTFTPDGDNRNDFVEFQIDNPKNGSTFGKIYDLRGALVGEMKKGSNYNPLTGDGSLIWDGRTISGETAPAGVYIYQIEVTGQETKTVNGIVVLAK